SSRARSRASRRSRPLPGATSEARNLIGYPRRARSPLPHGTFRLMQAIVSDQRTSYLESSGNGFLFRRLLQIGYTGGWGSSGSGNIVMPVIEPMPSSSRRGSFLRSHALIGAGAVYKDRCELSVPTEIFEGITYGCKRLDTTEEGNGLVHWMSINLATPDIELYVTPLDPVAVAQGWQYRLRRVGDVVDEEKLEVAVNGTLFESHSRWRPRMAGGRRTRRLPPNSLGRNGESADKRFGCKAAKSGAVVAVTRMHELRWPSIGSANSCFWPSANMSRRVWCCRNLQI